MSLPLTPINLPASWSLCFPASTQRRYRPVNMLSQPPACPGGAKCGGEHPRGIRSIVPVERRPASYRSNRAKHAAVI